MRRRLFSNAINVLQEYLEINARLTKSFLTVSYAFFARIDKCLKCTLSSRAAFQTAFCRCSSGLDVTLGWFVSSRLKEKSSNCRMLLLYRENTNAAVISMIRSYKTRIACVGVYAFKSACFLCISVLQLKLSAWHSFPG